VKKTAIVIPVKELNDYIEESLSHIERLDYDKSLLEIIVLPDNGGSLKGKYGLDIKIVPTGHVHPGEKRDRGIKMSEAEIIAFIDDDVFPAAGWLKRAVEIFERSEDIAAVGGPAVTPDNDSFRQKASGLIYESFLGGGGYRYRYAPEPARFVDDYPSCNLLVRKSVLDKIGGFNTEFWPGEDTVICLKIVKELKMKIQYDPEVLVFHHRRNFPDGHLKQVKSYALHRGYFVKRFPETSLKPAYFAPSAFTAYLVLLPFFALFFEGLRLLWFAPLGLYVLLLLLDGIRTKSPLFGPVVMAGIAVNHIYYGIYFIKGLFSRKLKEEKESKGDDK